MVLYKLSCCYIEAEGNRFTFLLFAKSKNNSSNQFLNWLQELSTGQLHFDRFDSPSFHKTIARTLYGCVLLFGGAEGQPVLTTKLSKDYIYSFRGDSSLLG